MTIRVRYVLQGAHFHLTVFVNGANAGRLVLREEEFHGFKAMNPSWAFIPAGE